MAKVVSSKFGNRQLVQLPPVSYSNSKSTEVPSIAPRYHTQVHGQHGNNTDRSVGNAQPIALAEGNIVRDINNPGPEFRFVEPNTGSPGLDLHYTPYAREQAQQAQQQFSTQPQIQPPQQQQTTVAPAQPLPAPAPTVQPNLSLQYQGTNPNEKHIFYGPNGELLPWPPQGFQSPVYRPKSEPLKDFVADGLLYYGRLVSVSNIDYTNHFPKLPDYLLNALKQKYGQYERTDVRIAYRAGQFNVHGVPNMPVAAEMPPPAAIDPISYSEPMEIVEYLYPGDEGYDEAKAAIDQDESRTMRDDRGHRRHRYSTARDDVSYRQSYHNPRDRGYRRYEVPRTATEDTMADFRWKKERATIIDDRKYKF